MWQQLRILVVAVTVFSADGLPWSCDDVAIIGAGPAGTYAAYRLRNKGLRISVFEYSDRVGGRLNTVRLPGAEDVNVEMGGMRFQPGTHFRVESVVKELGLTSMEFVEGYGHANRLRYFVRNTSLTKADVLTDKLPFNLTEEEKPHANDLLGYYLQKLIGENQTFTPENILTLKTFDGKKFVYELSYDEAMEIVGASDEAKALIRGTFGFTVDLESDASLAVLMDDYASGDTAQGPLQTVKEGMHAIPQTLLQKFLDKKSSFFKKHKFYKNHRLMGLEKKKKGKYDLHFEKTESKNGVTEGTGKAVRRCAKKVILAVPQIALSRIFWEPLQVDPNVRENLEAVILAPASKIALVFPEAFWQTATHNATVLKTDLPERQSYDFGDSEKGTSVIIASYADGEFTRFWRRKQLQGALIPNSLPGDNRVTTAMENQIKKDFARAFGLPASKVPAALSGAAMFYDAYPLGCGWTLWRKGRRWDQVGDALLRPEPAEDVFIATADVSPGFQTFWTEGAFIMVDKILNNYF